MTAPAEEVVEQGSDCTDQLGHYMCTKCYPDAPLYGQVYEALCGIRKPYQGPKWDSLRCVVCTHLYAQPCSRCGII